MRQECSEVQNQFWRMAAPPIGVTLSALVIVLAGFTALHTSPVSRGVQVLNVPNFLGATDVSIHWSTMALLVSIGLVIGSHLLRRFIRHRIDSRGGSWPENRLHHVSGVAVRLDAWHAVKNGTGMVVPGDQDGPVVSNSLPGFFAVASRPAMRSAPGTRRSRQNSGTQPQEPAGAPSAEAHHFESADIQAMAEQAEAASRLTLSEISHELRTPLTSVKGALNLIESGTLGDVNEEVRKTLQIALRNTNRVLGLVEQILESRKLEAGAPLCNAEPVFLRTFVEDLLAEMAGYAFEHDVGIDVNKVAHNAVISADPSMLKQILGNLVSNAIKHSNPGQSVLMKVSERPAHWRISVEDHGPGLNQADGDRIFASFGRLQPSDGINRQGWGLGLHIAQRLAWLQNATIDFYSEPGRGAEFFVDFPKPIALPQAAISMAV